MLQNWHGAIDSALNKIDYQARKLCNRIGRNQVGKMSGEDDITSRFAQAIEETLDNWQKYGFSFSVTAERLTSAGRNSEEKEYGGDLAVYIHSEGGPINYSKGVLIQSKLSRANKGSPLNGITSPEKLRLQEQCLAMQKVTPESYVWIYHETGMSVVNAGVVSSVNAGAMGEVQTRSIRDFFRQTFYCSIGDHNLFSDEAAFRQFVESRAISNQLIIDVSASG